METKEWFAEWFNSPYYHTLYKNRNDEEAQLFMRHLTTYLQIKEDEKLLDLACGKGRHSIFLNQLGFNTTGVDLASESIAHAKAFEQEGLRFFEHDMREVFPEKFDIILNLFTSFGYFESLDDNVQVLQSLKQMLNFGGRLVIDFLNPQWVKQSMVESETKTIDGINFCISKEIKSGIIYKHIAIDDAGKTLQFTEKVQALDLKTFEKLFKAAGFTLCQTFGDYKLNPYKENSSERLILIAKIKE